MSAEISIITPIFNKWNFTKSFLQDITQLDPSKVEVIIVDNGSSDDTAKELLAYEKQHHNLTVIRNGVNLGFGRACNLAYNISVGQDVVFLNNDIRVKKNYDTWIFDLVKSCREDNLVGPTGGKIDPKNNYEFIYETMDPKRDINYLSGWCLAGKREVFDKLVLSGEMGPFDSNTFFVFYEDTDLSFRARESGLKLEIVPVDATHFGHVTAKSLNLNKLYNESRKKFLAKWKK